MYDIHPRFPMLIVSMIVGAIFLLAVYLFRKNKEIFIALCWFLVFLLPIINIIPIQSASLMADRYAYFSLMGFALCLATVISRGNSRVVAVVTAVVLVSYGIIDFKRNATWKDEVSLFSAMTQDTPGKFIGFRNLAMHYYRKGDITPALANLEAADGKPDITVNYLVGDAYVFWKEHLLDQAEKNLLRAETLAGGANSELNLLLMLICEEKGDPVAAGQYRDKLRVVVGDIGKTIENRTIDLCRFGEKYIVKRQFTRAEIYLWQALRLNPQFVPALIDMGNLRSEQGNSVGAIQYFSKAIALEPLNASAHYNLAILYKMQGRTAEAQEEMVRFRAAEAVSRQKGSL
jgi:tetratricopeptide (TPR) repeat protein